MPHAVQVLLHTEVNRKPNLTCLPRIRQSRAKKKTPNCVQFPNVVVLLLPSSRTQERRGFGLARAARHTA